MKTYQEFINEGFKTKKKKGSKKTFTPVIIRPIVNPDKVRAR